MLKKGALLVSCLFAACAAGFAASDTSPDAKVREFVVADEPETLSLDPLHVFTTFESQFYTAIYEGLVVADPITLQPIPGVANGWQSSDGGTTWTFTLRTDALYSNGDRVRAQDFIATWMRMIEPANNAENSYLFDVIKGARAYRLGANKDPASVGLTAPNDGTLQVKLEGPSPHFLKMLTHIAFLPLHPSLLRSTGWNNASTVIGNGPFVMKSRVETEIVFDKNPRYWDLDNVRVERLRIRFMDDPTDATDAYITGKVQWVLQSLIDFKSLTADDKIEASPMFATTYFFLVCDQAPWSDWRVRRALALLAPWDKVRTRDTFYYPSELLVPTVPGYPIPKGIATQQVNEAKKLLADAGYPDGKGLPTLVVKLQKGSFYVSLVQTIADAWKTLIGLNVAITQVDASASYLAETKKRDYTVGVATWIGDYADPLTFLQMWTTGSNLNDARFSDKDYDTAVNDSMALSDTTKRYQRLSDAEQILLSRAVLLPLDHRPAINLINTDAIGGWFTNLLDVHPFKFVSFKARATPPGIAMAR